MNRILVLGASGHARVVIDTLERDGRFQIVGVIGRQEPSGAEECFGYRMLPIDEGDTSALRATGAEWFIVAIGDNRQRARVASRVSAASPWLRLASAVHRSAQVGRGVQLSPGGVLMAGAIVNPGSVVGELAIINTNASVDHDCLIGLAASIAPGASLGGEVRIGDYAAVGIGASVRNGISIGEGAIIGAGAVVVSDIEPGVVAYGVPARAVGKVAVAPAGA